MIVLAVSDPSDPTDEPVKEAAEQCQRTGDELIVCSVLNRHRPETGAELGRARGELRDHIEEITHLPVHSFSTVVEKGMPDQVIARLAHCADVALVVVGSEARSRWQGRGGLARQLIRHAHIPVLVARPGPSSGAVLVATDFSDPALPAIAAAVAEAERRHARLYVMHCVRLPMEVYWSAELMIPPMPILEDGARLCSEARERLTGSLRRLGARGRQIVRQGIPAQAIIEAAAEIDAELVVVGSHGRSGLKRFLMGSVAESVVSGAAAPTLVVPLENRPRYLH